MDPDCVSNVESLQDQDFALKRGPEIFPEQPSKRSCFTEKDNLSHTREEIMDKNNSNLKDEQVTLDNEENGNNDTMVVTKDDEDVIPNECLIEQNIVSQPTQETVEDEPDDVIEVTAPEKPKPDMIVIDDLNDDDSKPGPDEVPTAEERGFWKAVEDNPNDFASWTYLLQVVEKNGKLKQVQKAFDCFLKLYPYCYGYWKKYADQLKKLVSNEAAYEVFNDAVKVIPLSVDLWTYFIHFIAEWKNGDQHEIRTIYQRAVDACGQEYKSDKIWEAYVEWEKQTDRYRVLGLYKQFLNCIVQRHQYHFDKFREWIFFTPVKDMVTMEMIKELLTKHQEETERRRLETERKQAEAEEARKREEERIRVAAEQEAERLKKELEELRIKHEEEQLRLKIEAEEELKRKAEALQEDEMDTETEVNLDTEANMDTDSDKTNNELSGCVVVPSSEAGEDAPAESAETVEVPVSQQDSLQSNETPETKQSEKFVEMSTPESNNGVNIVNEEEFTKVDMVEPLPDSPDALTDRQEAAIREQILLDMAPVHEHVLAEIEEILLFEEGIKRPYFHVKELERTQLKNWKNYLDHVMQKQDNARTIILFERCLIACAFYEVFWIKYAQFMENIDKEKASGIYRRACMIHLIKKPQIHLTWAAFEENQGNTDVSREALDHIDNHLPGLISVTLRKAGLERRCGEVNKGAEILKDAIEKARNRETRDFWIMKYLTYTQYILHDLDLTRNSLNVYIGKYEQNKKLHLRSLDLEMYPSTAAPDHNKIVARLDAALASSLPTEDKTVFSQKKMTFLEEFSDNISSIVEAYEEHAKNYKKPELDKSKSGKDSSAQSYRRKDFSSSNRDRSEGRRYNSNYRDNSTYRDRRSNYGNRDENSTTQQYTSQSNAYSVPQQPPAPYMGMAPAYGVQQQQQYQQWYSQYAAQQYYSGQQRGY